MNTLKKSYYTITVPLENTAGEYMLIHGYTGAINIVPQAVGDLLSQENPNILQWDCPAEVLNQLIQRGFITTKTPDEEMAFAHKVANAVHLYQKQNYKKFYFLVNYNCNFRCPYCYENLISNKGKDWSHQIMTKETVDAAFDCLLEIEPNKDKHNKEIVLYGGEPLMEDNLSIVPYIVEKGVSLGYRFSAITNGYDLDLFADLLGPEQIKKIQITLDGDKAYHNKRRFHYKKGASFDKIIANIRLALNKGVKVLVRSNIDNLNTDSVRQLVEKFKEWGFTDNPLFSFYPAMLKDNPNNVLDATKVKSINFMESAKFEDVNDEFKNNTGAYSDLILYALKNKKPLQLRSTFCGAQMGLYILDPYRNIYCCLESVGIPKHIIGNYKAHLQWNETYPRWKERNTATIPACQRCKYALICGGGCAAKVMHIGMNEPYCNSFPTVLQANVRRAYRQYMTI